MAPDGWTIQPGENISSKITKGQSPGWQGFTYQDHGVLFVTSENVRDGMLDVSRPKFLSEEFNEKLKGSQLSPGDILINIVGASIGRSCMFRLVDTAANINQAVCLFRPNERAHGDYVAQYLQLQSVKNRLIGTQSESARPNLTLGDIRAFPFLLPSLIEQKKIAQILSTWDKAIDKVERLIENSKAQKKALMQRLLLGSERLPGFEGKWNVRHLEEVTVIAVSPVDKKSSPGEETVRLCNYTDVYYNDHILDDMDFMVATASNNEIERFSLRQGDVVITKDSETPDDIAIPAYVEQELNGVVCGYHLAIIRPDTDLADGQFLAYLFSLPHTRYYFFTLANGATRFGLGVESIRRASFSLPQIEEQKAIAKIIRTADAELFSLRKQLGALREEKKALMQQLLTGKRRVTVTDQDREPASA